jgi:large subunit ribosomal protein L30e
LHLSERSPHISLFPSAGKYRLGHKQTLKAIRNGEAQMVILANNCPTLKKSEVEYYAMLGKVNVIHYQGNNVELGTACGKLYQCSALSIIDAGDSDILRTAA